MVRARQVSRWIGPIAAGLVLGAGLPGCATSPETRLSASFARSAAPGFSAVPLRLPAARSPTAESANAGFAALARGDYAEANRDLTTALSHDPHNPSLNAANALAYHLRVRSGERTLFDLAETGYLVALDKRQDYQSAAIQLAHLYYENGRHKQAQRAAAYALRLDSSSLEALYLMAAASYYSGDVELALWAVDQARTLAPGDQSGRRMLPVVYSAAGLAAEAEQFMDSQSGSFSSEDKNQLNRRVAQWKESYQLAQFSSQAGQPAAPTAAAGAAPPPSAPLPGLPPVKPYGAAAAGDSTSPLAQGAATDQGALVYSWSDCQQQLNASGVQQSSGYFGSSGQPGDETVQLTALPSPCKGRPLPRMAVIDVVILRTDDTRTSGYGVNLLDNLSYFIQRSVTTTRAWGSDPATVQSLFMSYAGLGTTSGGGLAYSLNIANQSGQSAEVLARPSLLVLDRQPAQFFSGSNVTIALTSNLGSGSIGEKNIGVSLSVAPTFVSDNDILLNIKAARSFFEPTAESSTFQQSVQTSRNMVSAAAKVRFNQTLILSGLSERELNSQSSGVPVLKDIPGVQYLFSRKTNQDYSKSVLILLTPRRVSSFGETLDTVNQIYGDEQSDPKVLQETRARALKELGGTWPSLYKTLRHMTRNQLLHGVRSNDMRIDDWQQPPRLGKVLQEAVDTLYY